ncbi:MAG TPA: hypothetical protein VIO35_04365 [Chloroflexota bacterium]|jgi:hypothetical protein
MKPVDRGNLPNPLPTSASVHKVLRRSGKPVRRLGPAFGGEEVLCVETGGTRLPPILIGSILVDYVLRYGFAMSTETGAEAPLADRADYHVRAVLAGLQAFEQT